MFSQKKNRVRLELRKTLRIRNLKEEKSNNEKQDRVFKFYFLFLFFWNHDRVFKLYL